MRTLGTAALVLLLSGCLGGGEAEPTETPEPTGPVYDATQPLSVNYNANQCREAFVVALVEQAVAQKNLPKGYKAKDAQGLLGLPIAAGRYALWVNALNCAQSEFALGGIDEGGYGVFVEAPKVEGERAKATYDFYEFGRYTSKEETLDLLRSFDYGALEGTVDATITPQAGGVTTGSGQVRNDEGAVVYSLGLTAPANQPLKVRARFWHEAENGTGYFDYVVDTTVAQGSGSCTIRDLKIREKMGIDSCGNNAVSMGFPPYKFESQFAWLPGAKAA